MRMKQCSKCGKMTANTSAYTGNTLCYAKGCEHVEKNSPWTKEPPTEPGWYPALKQPQNGPPVEWEVVVIYDDMSIHMFYDPNHYTVDDFAMWGPRIDFPPLPEDEK